MPKYPAMIMARAADILANNSHYFYLSRARSVRNKFLEDPCGFPLRRKIQYLIAITLCQCASNIRAVNHPRTSKFCQKCYIFNDISKIFQFRVFSPPQYLQRRPSLGASRRWRDILSEQVASVNSTNSTHKARL